MHDARARLQRTEEIDGVVRRVAEEQCDRFVAAVAGAQEGAGRDLDPLFKLGIADRAVAEFQRRPRGVFGSGLRQEVRQRAALDRIVPADALRIILFAGMGHADFS